MFLNLVGKNVRVGKIVLYAEDSYKVKNQYLKSKGKSAGKKNSSTVFMHILNSQKR